MKYIYIITMMQDVVPDSEGSMFGIPYRMSTMGWFTNKKDAIEAVESNSMDIRECNNDYAVVEKSCPYLYTRVKGEWWFKWDEASEKYIAIEKPDLLKHVINFGMS